MRTFTFRLLVRGAIPNNVSYRWTVSGLVVEQNELINEPESVLTRVSQLPAGGTAQLVPQAICARCKTTLRPLQCRLQRCSCRRCS